MEISGILHAMVNWNRGINDTYIRNINLSIKNPWNQYIDMALKTHEILTTPRVNNKYYTKSEEFPDLLAQLSNSYIDTTPGNSHSNNSHSNSNNKSRHSTNINATQTNKKPALEMSARNSEKKEKQKEKEMTKSVTHQKYALGDHVMLTKDRTGIIRYIGHVKGRKGLQFGMEMTGGCAGDHNGTWEGIKYFQVCMCVFVFFVL